ncbi:MAG: TonB-dependent hemoglobin/transferrin/lactoferrin family receptor [Plesiomonas sp.]|uniref:TonB-dependent hemoglobin/transferrin/lactoferrin family receptor n=1 Tax=Plesiomonas sp. TaxID=2486279 RepID=UPI003F35FF9A
MANAETTQSTSTTTALPEVIVTATRDNKTLEQETRSVVVMNKAQIEQQQAASVAKVLKYAPNIDVHGGPRANAQSPTIRGLSGNQLLQVIDGARQNTNSGHRSTYFLDPEMLSSIEVIKGPSSALWGSGALGGVVALQTVSAPDLLTDQPIGGYIKQGYGSANDDTRTSASLYGMPSDAIDFLLNGYYVDANNVRLGNGEKLTDSSYRNQGGLAKVGWQVDDAQRLQLSVRQSENHQNAPSNPSEAISSSVPLVQQKTRDFNTTLDYRVNPQNNPLLDAHITTYLNKTEFDEYRIQKAQHDTVNYRTLGMNINNRSTFDFMTLVYGGDIYQDKTEGQREGPHRPIPADARAQVWGTYLQADIPLVTNWSLQPGIRYDHFNIEDKNIADSSRSESNVSPSVGLRWQAADWLTLNARYDEAFRAPSMEEMYTSGTHFCMGPNMCNTFLPNPDLKPEKAKNKEISANMKFSHVLADDELALNATYFHNNVSNYIDQRVDRLTTQYQNVNDALLKGIELTALYNLQNIETSLSYAKTDGENQSNGQPLQNIPAQKWVLGAGHYFMDKSLKVGMNVSHYQAQDKLPENVTEVYPSYTLIDLYTTWQPQAFKAVKVDIGIDNLTDEYYRQAFNQLYSAGRNFKIGVRYQF